MTAEMHEITLTKGSVPHSIAEPITGNVLVILSKPKSVTRVEVAFVGKVETSWTSNDRSIFFEEVLIE